MGSERAQDRGPGDIRDAGSGTGRLLLFPQRRAFGPLSWRAVRIASLAVLLLIAVGALVDLFVGSCRSSDGAPAPESSRSRS